MIVYVDANLAVNIPPVFLVDSAIHSNWNKTTLRPALLLSSTALAMSTQIKEFIDIPQQFVRDGNQVSSQNLRHVNRNAMACSTSVLLADAHPRI